MSKERFLIVVDMQNDFVDGALANPAAKATIPFIKAQIEHARENDIRIIYTRDTHGSDYMETSEGRHLPVPHCINETKGWEIVDELKPTNPIVFAPLGVICKLIESSPKSEIIVNKTHFGFDGWRHLIPEDSEVTILGTVTSICVVSNALAMKAIEGVEVTVLAEGCSGLSNEDHEAALKTMEMCQCKVIRNLAETVAVENKAQEMGA